MDGNGLGSALEQSRKEILKNKDEYKQIQKESAAQTPSSQSTVQPAAVAKPPVQEPKKEGSSPTPSTPKPKEKQISATQLAEDAISAPFNINSYLNEHGLDQ